jgi:predicted nucleotidyltransferase
VERVRACILSGGEGRPTIPSPLSGRGRGEGELFCILTSKSLADVILLYHKIHCNIWVIMNNTEKEYLTGKIVEIISNIFNGKLLSVILYGSYAEDRETPYSDIDILIILDREFSNWRERRQIDVLLRRETSSIYQISPKVISERELTSSLENYNPLILNILLSGKPIYDTGIFAKAKKQFESMYGKKIVKNAENYWEIAL